MSAWLRAHPDAHIAINVPPEIVGRGGIEYVGNKSGLSDVASQLVFELTERGLPDLIGLNAINGAKAFGIRVAIDDVSLHGAAQAAVLARANIDIVKLDRSLIAQIGPDCPHPAWLDDMVALNRTPRLTVVAEGVESLQQLRALQAAGFKAAQGYYLSPPLAAADFIAFHRDHRTAVGAPGS